MHDLGVLNVGFDGVARSFAPDGTVIDFRQLDPGQMVEFATKQLAGWKATPYPGQEIPASVIGLAEAAPGIDGRLVTDLDQLLYPADKPTFLDAKESVTTDTSPADHADVLGTRASDKVQACLIGWPCNSVAICVYFECGGCFFPNGPPLGLCVP